MMGEYIQIFTTTESKEYAENISRMLVERRLSGCVQIIGPITSTYWWNGNVETAEEWLLIIKTMKTHYDDIEKVIKDVHTYETPEIIAIPIVDGSKEYLEWLENEVKKE